ncbi:MAG: sigma-70 family RNA polymerase sigma factor [Vicinamibacterales bacterium]
MTPRLDEDGQRLLRELAPRVLAILVRRYRDFSGCEDAAQEALIAAARQWPSEGRPDHPLAWLVRVATRRLTDQIRADAARRHREHLVVSLVPAESQIALAADAGGRDERDETLDLYFMCCHPALTPASQVALTLRAVGGLTTAEIARAFYVPESTMAQRLSRAKQAIRAAGRAFEPLESAGRDARLPRVLQILYLIFSEGYASSSGSTVYRVDLSAEAIRVVRLLLTLVPDHAEVEGLLALMLLTDARRAARIGALGELVPLDAQDRSQWHGLAIAEGTALLCAAFGRGAPGPYQVQAAIAALHDEAPSFDATDWPQIVALYDVLIGMQDSPGARLSRAIAFAMVHGPRAGLAALEDLEADPRLHGSARVEGARAHLLERAGETAAAVDAYRRAARGTTSTAERDYLLLHAAELAGRLGR